MYCVFIEVNPVEPSNPENLPDTDKGLNLDTDTAVKSDIVKEPKTGDSINIILWVINVWCSRYSSFSKMTKRKVNK